MTKRILVTGGNGFIGSHFVLKSLSLGYSILNIDIATYATEFSLHSQFDHQNSGKYKHLKFNICETNKLKKGVYSKIVGLDIRIDYLKNLIKNEENNQNSENGDNSDSNKTLNYDEKHDINKRLAIFYNKNLDILNIIYKILYYIYLSLFVIYFALCIFNFYMYKYKEEDEYFDKFKFTLIGTLLITFIPMLLKHILNKYMFF